MHISLSDPISILESLYRGIEIDGKLLFRVCLRNIILVLFFLFPLLLKDFSFLPVEENYSSFYITSSIHVSICFWILAILLTIA